MGEPRRQMGFRPSNELRERITKAADAFGILAAAVAGCVTTLVAYRAGRRSRNAELAAALWLVTFHRGCQERAEATARRHLADVTALRCVGDEAEAWLREGTW